MHVSPIPPGGVCWLAFSPDACQVAILSVWPYMPEHHRVTVLCAVTGRQIYESSPLWQALCASDDLTLWSKDSEHVITGCIEDFMDSNTVHFATFLAHTGQCMHSATCLSGHLERGDYISSLGFSDTGKFACVTAEESGDIFFCRVTSGTVLFRLSEVIPNHCNESGSLFAWHSDDIVVPSQQGFSLLNLKACAVTRSWPWNNADVRCQAQLSPAGTMLCDASRESVARM